jgi:uncharacterized protein GlcG (DUF336 family)
VAVVDRAGVLLVVLRHELAHPVTVEMSSRSSQATDDECAQAGAAKGASLLE